MYFSKSLDSSNISEVSSDSNEKDSNSEARDTNQGKSDSESERAGLFQTVISKKKKNLINKEKSSRGKGPKST